MTLDEAIKHAEEVAEENQRVVDTGIVFDDVTVDMLFCDDTEVIEEHLANYQRCADEHRELAEWLKDYKRLLEQQPSDDCVSRKQALLAIRNLYPSTPFVRINLEKWQEENKKYFECEDKIKALPPVTPTQRWISVSERLPKPNTAVLIYVSTGPSETFCLANWNDIQNGWEDWIGSKLIEKDRGYKVLAWQPLSEPYKEKRGSEDGI